jgi:hypothetical protein
VVRDLGNLCLKKSKCLHGGDRHARLAEPIHARR